IRAQGYVSYNQPIGNTHSASDWSKFGPGAVLRSGPQTYYYDARTLIGDQGVQDAMNPQNSSPISLFSDKRVSGYDIDSKGDWTLDAENKISAESQLSSATDVDIKFGNAWLANPKSEGEMHQDLRTAAKNIDSSVKTGLVKGRFLVVQNAVFTDSVRYYFKQK